MTEPICQALDASKDSMLLFDTSGIEVVVSSLTLLFLFKTLYFKGFHHFFIKKSNDLLFSVNTVSINHTTTTNAKGIHCLWILLPTYLVSFNFNTNKFAGLFILSVDTSHLSSGLLMIPILLNTKNSRLMNFPVLSAFSRIGLTRSSSPTLKNATVLKLPQSDVAQNPLFLRIAAVLAAVPLNFISIRTMALKGSSYARSAIPRFLL